MYLLLINPEAGGRRFQCVERRMKQALDRHNIKYRFVLIDDLSNIPQLIEDNLKPSDQAVIAVGGNATVNSVINALANKDVPLGIIPMSKTNYLARGVGITNWRQAVDLLSHPEFRSERLGKIGQHYFIGAVKIASRQNLLTSYLTKVSPWQRFLGLTAISKTGADNVTTQMLVDDELKAAGEAKSIEIALNGEKSEKKLKIQLWVGDTPDQDPTLLHGNVLTVESDRKMPVLMGNETVAHTPVEVRGLSKCIKLIIPKSKNEKLTA